MDLPKHICKNKQPNDLIMVVDYIYSHCSCVVGIVAAAMQIVAVAA